MIKRQEVQSLRGVNADASYKIHKPADAASMVNTRILDFLDGDSADIQNVLGNTEVVNAALESGTNTVIGAISSEKDDKIFFLVYNETQSKHAIYTFDGSSFTKLVSNAQFTTSNALGFKRDHVTAIAFVNDFLLYSTGTGEVRAINIDYWTNNSPTGVLEAFIYLNVPAPTYSPTYTLNTTTAGNENLQVSLRKWRFYYRFVYNDGRISPSSPASEIKNIYDLDASIIASITVDIPFSQTIPSEVDAVQLVAYEKESDTYMMIHSEKDDTAIANHNSSTTKISTTFTNNGVYPVISADAMFIYPSMAPLDVFALDSAKTRLFFSNYKDSLDISATADLPSTVAAVTQNNKTGTSELRAFSEGASFSFGIRFFDATGRSSEVIPLDSEFTTPWRHENGTWSELYTGTDTPDYVYDEGYYADYIESVSVSLTNITAGDVPTWATRAQLMISANKAHGDFIQFPLHVSDASPSTGSVKYQFGLRYAYRKDDGSFTIANSAKYIRDTEMANSAVDEPMRFYALNLRDAIRHGHGWTYTAGDSVEVSFLQRRPGGGQVHYDEKVVRGAVIAEQNNHLIFTKDHADHTDYLGYSTDATLSDEGDSKINGQGVATVWRAAINRVTYSEASEAFSATSLPSSVTVYGDCVMNQIGVLPPHNIQYTEKTILLTNSRGAVDHGVRTYDEFYGRTLASSELTDIISGTRKKTALTFSGVYTEGTKNNNLNFVGLANEEVLPAGLAQVMKLATASKVEEVGQVMLAIGEDETASVYIGETQLVGSSSDATLIADAKVIGSVNILKGGYGTQHPESVSERHGNIYFLDINKAAVVRYSQAGLFDISSYNYRSVIKDMSTNNNASCSYVAGYDPLNEEYLVSAINPLRTTTSHLTDYSVLTDFDAGVDFDGAWQDNISPAKDEVVEVKVTFLRANNDNVAINFNGVPVYKAFQEVYAQNDIIYARFLGGGTTGAVTITGVTTDSTAAVDANVTIKRYKYDFSAARPTLPCTHVFNPGLEGWRGYDTYQPEALVSLGQDLYSFKGGKMYKHNQGSSVSFYGQAQSPAFSYYLDYQGDMIAVPVSHQFLSTGGVEKFRLSSEDHVTELVAADYRQKERVYKANFKRDKLTTPNMLTGKRLRGSKLLSLFRMPSQFRIEKIFTDIKDSTGH